MRASITLLAIAHLAAMVAALPHPLAALSMDIDSMSAAQVKRADLATINDILKRFTDDELACNSPDGICAEDDMDLDNYDEIEPRTVNLNKYIHKLPKNLRHPNKPKSDFRQNFFGDPKGAPSGAPGDDSGTKKAKRTVNLNKFIHKLPKKLRHPNKPKSDFRQNFFGDPKGAPSGAPGDDSGTKKVKRGDYEDMMYEDGVVHTVFAAEE